MGIKQPQPLWANIPTRSRGPRDIRPATGTLMSTGRWPAASTNEGLGRSPNWIALNCRVGWWENWTAFPVKCLIQKSNDYRHSRCADQLGINHNMFTFDAVIMGHHGTLACIFGHIIIHGHSYLALCPGSFANPQPCSEASWTTPAEALKSHGQRCLSKLSHCRPLYCGDGTPARMAIMVYGGTPTCVFLLLMTIRQEMVEGVPWPSPLDWERPCAQESDWHSHQSSDDPYFCSTYTKLYLLLLLSDYCKWSIVEQPIYIYLYNIRWHHIYVYIVKWYEQPGALPCDIAQVAIASGETADPGGQSQLPEDPRQPQTCGTCSRSAPLGWAIEVELVSTADGSWKMVSWLENAGSYEEAELFSTLIAA